MSDKILVCMDCSKDFPFSERDQEFFRDRGFENPKRCKDCRTKKKQQSGNRGGFRDR